MHTFDPPDDMPTQAQNEAAVLAALRASDCTVEVLPGTRGLLVTHGAIRRPPGPLRASGETTTLHVLRPYGPAMEVSHSLQDRHQLAQFSLLPMGTRFTVRSPEEALRIVGAIE